MSTVEARLESRKPTLTGPFQARTIIEVHKIEMISAFLLRLVLARRKNLGCCCCQRGSVLLSKAS